jgi:hypothetical protein
MLPQASGSVQLGAGQAPMKPQFQWKVMDAGLKGHEKTASD